MTRRPCEIHHCPGTAYGAAMLCADHLEAHARDIGHAGAAETAVLLLRAQELVSVYSWDEAENVMAQYHERHAAEMVEYARWCERKSQEATDD